MKNLFRIAMSFALAAVAITACQKEIEQPIDEEQVHVSSHVSFYAEAGDPATRATLTTEDNKSFKAAWENTDQISLYATNLDAFDETKPATWNADKGCFDAAFETVAPTTPGTWMYEAVYPYTADGNIPFGTNRVQNGNAYNSAYDVMYGTVDYDNALLGKDNNGNVFVIPMHRLTGIAYFNIKGGPDEDVVSATLEATGIAAESVAIANDGASVTPSSTLNSITITFAEGTAPKASDLKLWFNVLPGSYSGLKLTINTATKTAVLNSNKQLTYTAGKLNKAVLSSLNWKDASAPSGTVLFSEPFTGFEADDVPTEPGTSAVIYKNATVTYTCQNGGGTTKIYAANLAGGESPEILVAKTNGEFAITGIPTGNNTSLTVKWNSNNTNIGLVSNSPDVVVGEEVTELETHLYQAVVTVPSGMASVNLSFKNTTGSNGRLDNVLVVAGAPVGKVKTPSFNPAAGEVSANTVVTISTETEGATIYYTTGKSEYSAGDWIQGSSVTIDADKTIQAIAIKEGMTNSEVATATYTVAVPSMWVETNLVDISSSDIVVIVGNNGNNFALSNDNGTSSAPTAVSVTVSGTVLTSEISDDIKWNIGGDNTNGYIFYPNGSTTTWLYTTTGNNGLRIGNSEHNLVYIANNGYMTIFDGTDTRYIGVYNSSDWRSYTSVNSNIKDQTFKFYKRTVSDGKVAAEVTLSHSGTITYGDDPIQLMSNPHGVNVTCSSSNEAVATVTNTGVATIIGAGTTTITASWAEQTIDGVTYRAGTDTYTLTVAKAGVIVAFSDPTTEVEVGSTVENVATVTPSGLTVTYSSSNTSAATVNENGVVTGVANGLATITASFEGNANYESASDSYTLTVGDGVNDGSLAHPYNATEVLGLTSASDVYVAGTIKSITEVSLDYGNATYVLTDGTSDIIVYRGKFINGADFTSESQIKNNDQVIVFGNIGKYNGVSQVSSGNKLVSINGITKILTAGTLEATPDHANKQITVTWGAATGTNSQISYVITCGGQNHSATAAGSHTFTMDDYGTYDVSVVASASDAISATATTTATLNDPSSGFTPFNVWEDSFSSCSSSATALTSLSGSTSGFTGNYTSISTTYPMDGAIRVGKASGGGSITTPTLSTISGSSCSLTVSFVAAGWNGKTAKLTLSVNKGTVTEGQTTITSESTMAGSTPTMTGTSYTFHITGADNTTAITFSTTNSIGIDNLVITQTSN